MKRAAEDGVGSARLENVISIVKNQLSLWVDSYCDCREYFRYGELHRVGVELYMLRWWW